MSRVSWSEAATLCADVVRRHKGRLIPENDPAMENALLRAAEASMRDVQAQMIGTTYLAVCAGFYESHALADFSDSGLASVSVWAINPLTGEESPAPTRVLSRSHGNAEHPLPGFLAPSDLGIVCFRVDPFRTQWPDGLPPEEVDRVSYLKILGIGADDVPRTADGSVRQFYVLELERESLDDILDQLRERFDKDPAGAAAAIEAAAKGRGGRGVGKMRRIAVEITAKRYRNRDLPALPEKKGFPDGLKPILKKHAKKHDDEGVLRRTEWQELRREHAAHFGRTTTKPAVRGRARAILVKLLKDAQQLLGDPETGPGKAKAANGQVTRCTEYLAELDGLD